MELTCPVELRSFMENLTALATYGLYFDSDFPPSALRIRCPVVLPTKLELLKSTPLAVSV